MEQEEVGLLGFWAKAAAERVRRIVMAGRFRRSLVIVQLSCAWYCGEAGRGCAFAR
jgi:hypothetical protein